MSTCKTVAVKFKVQGKEYDCDVNCTDERGVESFQILHPSMSHDEFLDLNDSAEFHREMKSAVEGKLV